MNFDDFIHQLSKINNLPLPGETSHFKMAPELRIKELKSIRAKKENAKKAAVMALFYPKQDNETHLLLILRKTYQGVHSNQVGFPGGKVEDQDMDLLETALRETYEEVGVPVEAVKTVCQLTQVYIPPSNFEVQPYMGYYHMDVPFKIQESEVETLIEVPLLDFMNDENIVGEKRLTSYAGNISVPAFKLNGYVVWGATAMMLSEVKDLLKQVL
ncbi:NUDIX hydrolase [Spongiimicrobium salis]|uniref:NUDIX hydrolase n=1 Tax=Spongiimicrobium salis TaxID=1667022 RepID=UPI00374D41DB